ncbi:MAG: hypothetical protein IH991_17175, partial [Planctomycetes bacterium]|nr:hypothetical protein [Planctomycetota bacterium]
MGSVNLYEFFTTAVLATFSLSAVWAAVSTRHWFWRLLVLLVIAAIMLPARAYSFAVLFLVYSFAIVFIVAASRAVIGRIQRSKQDSLKEQTAGKWFRFTLSDFIFGTVIVSSFAGIVGIAVRHEVPFENLFFFYDLELEITAMRAYFIFPGVIAVSALAAIWLIIGRSVLWLRLIGFFLAIAMCDTAVLGSHWSTMTFALLLITWLICYDIARGRVKEVETERKTRSCSRLRWIGFAGCAIFMLVPLVPCSYIYWKLVRPIDVPPQTRPKPNGYVELVLAARSIDTAANPYAVTPTPTDAAFEAYVVANSDVLKEADAALELESEVPTTSMSNKIDHLPDLRELGRLFGYQFDAAIRAKQIPEAMHAFINCRLLGARTAHGGLHIDWAVAVAIDDLTQRKCFQDVLSTSQLRELISQLLSIEQLWESYETFDARD